MPSTREVDCGSKVSRLNLSPAVLLLRAAIAVVACTNGSELIVEIALASDVWIVTPFNHFEIFSIVTFATFRICATYVAGTGRSVLSIGMLYRVLRVIARFERYGVGSPTVN